MGKNKKEVRKVANDEILCILPILVVLGQPIPYKVCENNREKITKSLINFLMGNNVEFNEKSTQEAIDYLFERDHEDFLSILLMRFVCLSVRHTLYLRNG